MKKVKLALDKTEIENIVVVEKDEYDEIIAINKEIYIELFEKNLIKKLKKAEEQIRNGEVVDGEIVLKEMREKYEY